MTSTPAEPTPDPVKEPGTKGATGGPSVTGEVHMPRDYDDDSVNGSLNLEQKVAPDAFRDKDPSNHGSR
ncbi:hypothetical protein [Sphingomonas montana]|uniref:hypothetical protein n=1 Tax=Sphingomonas montana TaxID=1843236 RepID=UPI00096EFA9B|nr:hypothetical protein [Sphingomonas montana]